MLLEGIKLLFVGMGTVVLFLCFMIFLLQLVATLTKDHTAKEFDAIELERKLLAKAAKEKKKRELEAQKGPVVAEDEDDLAAIAAAIAAFEADRVGTC